MICQVATYGPGKQTDKIPSSQLTSIVRNISLTRPRRFAVHGNFELPGPRKPSEVSVVGINPDSACRRSGVRDIGSDTPAFRPCDFSQTAIAVCSLYRGNASALRPRKGD